MEGGLKIVGILSLQLDLPECANLPTVDVVRWCSWSVLAQAALVAGHIFIICTGLRGHPVIKCTLRSETYSNY
jgi:hypothetical protein